MSTQGYEYQKVRQMLMPQMRRCRDRNIRVKVELLLRGLKLGSVRLACAQLGFSRSGYYKWWHRLVQGRFKVEALTERSRRPKKSPQRLEAMIEKRIRYYRRRGFGALMIREYLRREGFRLVSPSTIQHVIKWRSKVAVKRRQKRMKKHRKRYELPVPGQRIQMDVKYSPMPVEGRTSYIYVAIDECTRWRYCKSFPGVNEHWTMEFMKDFEGSFPFPIHGIQTDNGHEFTFKLLHDQCRDHHLETWCRKRKIKLTRIPPGVKELNGKVERSHRIDADYFYGRAPTDSLAAFNRSLERWIHRYNTERPHGGLDYQTPLEKLKERIKALNNLCFTDGSLEQLRKIFTKSVKLLDRDQGGRTAA